MGVDADLGGIVLGNFFAIMLYGMTLLQVYIYHNDNHDDGLMLRYLVVGVLILETLHSAFCIFTVYITTVTHFGDLTSPDLIIWSEPALILTGVLLMFAVHCFFIRRVWKICGKPVYLTTLLYVLALTHLAFGLATYVSVTHYDTWTDFKATNISLIIVCGGLGSACLTDILIAGFLFFYLRRGRDHNHVKFSSAINRLIFYIVITGAFTAITSIGTVISFTAVRANGVFLGMATIQSKGSPRSRSPYGRLTLAPSVYANSLLATLNTRRSIRDRLQSSDDEVEFTSILPIGMPKPTSSARARGVATWDHALPEPYMDNEDEESRGRYRDRP